MEVNAEETKYTVIFWQQNARQNCSIKVYNIHFENMSWFMYLGMTVTKQNYINEEINDRLD
jgi:hypothetical protein